MPGKPDSLDTLLYRATDRLGAVETPRLDAEVLLSHCLDRGRSWLIAHREFCPEPADCARFDVLIERRRHGEPVAYLTGRREFWSLDLEVSPATLIPRPDTEILVAAILERVPPDTALRLLDLGTGSGAVALAVASERPAVRVTATDIDPDTLAVARSNAERLGLDNVSFVLSDWFAGLPAGAPFDVVASNPPYVRADDPHLAAPGLRFEPQAALVAGADGLDDLRAIVAGARSHLVNPGWLLLEHGAEQRDDVRQLLTDAGFADVDTREDLAGRPRVAIGRRQRL